MLNHYVYLLLTILGVVIYSFIPAKHLRDIHTVPVLPYILSFIRGKPTDKLNEDLIAPLLYQHGIVKIWLGRWVVVVSDLDVVKGVLNKTNFYNKQSFVVSSPYSMFKRLFGTNVVFIDGKEWKRHRMVINPAFHRSWSTNIVGECCEVFLKKLSEKKGALEILPLVKNLTLDILGKAIFDYDFNAVENPKGEHVARYTTIIESLFKSIFILFPFLEYPIFNLRSSLRNEIDKFRGTIEELMNEKKKLLNEKKEFNVESMDLLTMMIKATITSNDDNAKLSEKEMIDNVTSFFAAGHDTTANTLAFVLYYLSANPDIQDKAREEVRKVIKERRIVPNHEQLKALHYITAVIYEVMRIKPTFDLIPRNISENVEIMPGKFLPKDQNVAVSVYAVSHDPKYWDEPQLFKPERFLTYQLGEDGEEHLIFDKSSTKAWYSFGGGPRACIGASFSIMEQKILLAMLLDRFTLSLPQNSPHIKEPVCNSGFLSFPLDLKIEFTAL